MPPAQSLVPRATAPPGGTGTACVARMFLCTNGLIKHPMWVKYAVIANLIALGRRTSADMPRSSRLAAGALLLVLAGCIIWRARGDVSAAKTPPNLIL